MTDFIWPSDTARAESDELNRVCEYLEEALDDRDALAAHVEACREVFENLSEYWNGGEGMAAEDAARHAMDASCDMLEVLPTTSLARMKDERAQAIQQAVKRARMEWAREDKAELDRLKAQWQAEALAEMIAAVPFREELAREMIKHKRDELRRQAEGGE